MVYFVKSLLLIADSSDYPPALETMPSEWESAASEIKSSLRFDGNLIFLIGPWGSGKSTFLSTLLRQSKDSGELAHVDRISLSTATSTDEVFSHLINHWIKIGYLVAAGAISIVSLRYVTWPVIADKVLKEYPTISFFVSLFIAFFVTNKFRLFYIISSYLELLWGNKIKLIEDFDRGSLSPTDIFNTLSFRFRTRTSYIVALGYSSPTQKDSFIETALKLGGKIILFDLSIESLHLILAALYPNPPLGKGEWIRFFTARKIISITSKIIKASNNLNEEQKFFVFIDIYFEELAKELKLEDLGFLKFNSDGRSLNPSPDDPLHQTRTINSFLGAIDQKRYMELTKDKQKAVNWGAVFMSNLLRSGSYRSLRSAVETIDPYKDGEAQAPVTKGEHASAK